MFSTYILKALFDHVDSKIGYNNQNSYRENKTIFSILNKAQSTSSESH